MLELVHKISEEYLKRDDVNGVFIGPKLRNGRLLDDFCVQIRVKEKLPQGRIIPGHIIPKELCGLKTDVVQSNFKPAGYPTDQFGVVQGGIAIGPEDTPATTGTAGMICYDASDNYNVGILTCHHVCVVTANNSRYILQPSLNELDSPTTSDRVGTLTRSLLNSRNDSAIVKLTRPSYSFELFSSKEIITSVELPSWNWKLEKCGAATGVSHEDVTYLGSTTLDYGDLGGEITIDGFISGYELDGTQAQAGDSGSILYRPGLGVGVGLLVAVDAEYQYVSGWTFSCYLSYVMDDLNLVLDYDGTATSYWSEVVAEQQLYWIGIGDEMTLNFTIAPENDLYHVYLFTESAFADGVNGVMWGKRSTDAEYSLVGPHSMSPSCFIGDIASGESVTINLKLQPTSMLSELSEYEIPVYVGHGSTLRGGYV